MSPWTTRVERDGEGVRLELLLSTDPGPTREFRPFLEVTIDQATAVMLFGELGLALQELSDATSTTGGVVLPFPGRDG